MTALEGTLYGYVCEDIARELLDELRDEGLAREFEDAYYYVWYCITDEEKKGFAL